MQNEYEMSVYNLDEADVEGQRKRFDLFVQEAHTMLEKRLPVPAYDHLLKASHAFNILDARSTSPLLPSPLSSPRPSDAPLPLCPGLASPTHLSDLRLARLQGGDWADGAREVLRRHARPGPEGHAALGGASRGAGVPSRPRAAAGGCDSRDPGRLPDACEGHHRAVRARGRLRGAAAGRPGLGARVATQRGAIAPRGVQPRVRGPSGRGNPEVRGLLRSTSASRRLR